MNFVAFGIAGLLGIAFHVLIAIRQMNNMLPKETVWSVAKAYFKTDGLAIVISLLTVGTVMFLLAGKLPSPSEPDKTGDSEDWLVYNLLKYSRVAGIVIGYFGDSIIYAWLGKVGKTLAEKNIPVTDPNQK